MGSVGDDPIELDSGLRNYPLVVELDWPGRRPYNPGRKEREDAARRDQTLFFFP